MIDGVYSIIHLYPFIKKYALLRSAVLLNPRLKGSKFLQESILRLTLYEKYCSLIEVVTFLDMSLFIFECKQLVLFYFTVSSQ